MVKPEWQEAYQDALRETDREKLMTKISAAEVALFSRLQQMHEPIGKDEVIAIYDAIHSLRTLSCDLSKHRRRARLAISLTFGQTGNMRSARSAC